MMNKRKFRFLRKLFPSAVCGILILCLLTGCGSETWSEIVPEPVFSAPVFNTPTATEVPPTRNGDGVLTLNYAEGFSMNPFVSQSEANLLLCGLLYEPMVTVAPGFHAEPCVFASWTHEAGVLFRFTIKSGLRFSDGSEVRNWDVLYSLNRAQESGSHYQSRLKDIAEAYVEGDGIVIRLKSSNPSFPLRLDIPVVKEGSAYSDLPIGSGPYILVKTNNGAELNASITYPKYAELPLQTIALVSLPQEQLNSAFADGTVDMLVSSTGTDVAFLVPGDAERRYLDTTILHFLIVSPDSGALSDPNRRRLLSAAMNRNSISALLGGNASLLPISLGTGYVSNTWIEDSVPKDIEAFKIDILTEDYDGDGILEYFVGGEPRAMILRLLYCSDSSSASLAASRIRTDFQGIGISVTLVPAEMSEYRSMLRSGNYDLCLASVRLTSDFDLTQLLCSDGSLYCGGCSSELQQAVREFRSAEDTQREECAKTMCILLAQECPILPICFSRNVLVVGRGVAQGLNPTWTDPYRRPMDWIPGNV